MPKIIAVVSGKGGTGKTTVAGGLAKAFAKLNYSVLAVDLCFARRNLDYVLGEQNSVVFDISDVLTSKCSIESAIIKTSHYDNLKLLCVSDSFKKNFDINHCMDIIIGLKNKFDYIILDLPDDMAYTTYVAGNLADFIVGVVTPELLSLKEVKRTTDEIYNNYNKPCRILVNKASADMFLENNIRDIDYIINYIRLPLLGVIPYNGCSLNIFDNKTVKTHQTEKIFDAVARRINGEYVSLILKNV